MKDVRIITVPGDVLLPQNCAPTSVPDIGDAECVRVFPPRPPWSPRDAIERTEAEKAPYRLPQFDTRYWRLSEGGQHPTETHSAWENNPGSSLPVVGFGCGLDRVPPVVEFRFKPKTRKLGLPDYWELGGALVISSRVLKLLLEVDPDAIVFRPIRMRDLDNVVFDQDHYLVDVVRIVAAIDYSNSVVQYMGAEEYNGERHPAHVQMVPSARVREDIDPKIHIFRQQPFVAGGLARGCFINDALKRQLAALQPRPRNLRFAPLFEGVY